MDFTVYGSAFSGLLIVLVTLVVQSFVANMSKARLPNHIPGKIDPSLGHESFAYRAHRTMENSLENLGVFLGSAFLAIFINVDPFWTALTIWVYALVRIVHMILYYLISTEKNPSPRSYFYLLGLLANILLLILIFAQL
ncbi:MAG: glutathione S-transferase [Psychromonas sp.]|jgi:glutathione S-transferase|uniref:MAPEG family protein n=1 Tax=Psychromonas sp. TaxID=1884585 RepID=UPI0039E5F0EB